MAYLIFSNDAPEAEEYDNGKLWFDETNPDIVKKIGDTLVSGSSREPAIYAKLVEVCNDSVKRRRSKLRLFLSKSYSVFFTIE